MPEVNRGHRRDKVVLGMTAGRPGLRPVDRLDVLVLVDNVTDHLSTNPEGVQSEFAALRGAGLTTIAGETICCAHHGLSLLITAQRDGRRHSLLLDTGPEGYAIRRNGALLGADFGDRPELPAWQFGALNCQLQIGDEVVWIEGAPKLDLAGLVLLAD